MSFAEFFVPGAAHTRLEHSLGTLYLMKRVCKELSFEKEESFIARVAALVHDLFHPPRSHALDPLFCLISEEYKKYYIGGNDPDEMQLIKILEKGDQDSPLVSSIK